MDHYEVRTWVAWHRFVTLCLLAHARVPSGWHRRGTCGRPAGRGRGKGSADPSVIPLTVLEVRRLVRAMAEPEERHGFRLGWSHWRQAHQAVAARCHATRRARRFDKPPPRSARLALASLPTGLTDAEWERVRPVLPPQKPQTGRPRHDHCTVRSGILSVVDTDLSWREIPKQYGKWERAYKRYRRWRDQGL